jgi:hypothetical protein
MRVPSGGPPMVVQPVGQRRGDAADAWRVTWEIGNRGELPITILAAWKPHGRFRAAELAFDPPYRLEPGETTTLELAVACAGEPGEVVENCFLILRVLWGEAPWRVLTRLTLHYDAERNLTIVPEVTTTQPIGFWRGGD